MSALSFSFTISFPTHNAVIAEMADRVVHLSGGKIIGVETNTTKREAAELMW